MTVTININVPHTWYAKAINSMNNPRIHILRRFIGVSGVSFMAGSPVIVNRPGVSSNNCWDIGTIGVPTGYALGFGLVSISFLILSTLALRNIPTPPKDV